VDAAIDQVAAAKGLAGAAESRLQVAESLNAETSLALSEAKSNIHNLDFALETAKLAKALVLQKASSAVLAQANASREVVLKLLEEF
jgi:flagellin